MNRNFPNRTLQNMVEYVEVERGAGRLQVFTKRGPQGGSVPQLSLVLPTCAAKILIQHPALQHRVEKMHQTLIREISIADA